MCWNVGCTVGCYNCVLWLCWNCVWFCLVGWFYCVIVCLLYRVCGIVFVVFDCFVSYVWVLYCCRVFGTWCTCTCIFCGSYLWFVLIFVVWKPLGSGLYCICGLKTTRKRFVSHFVQGCVVCCLDNRCWCVLKGWVWLNLNLIRVCCSWFLVVDCSRFLVVDCGCGWVVDSLLLIVLSGLRVGLLGLGSWSWCLNCGWLVGLQLQ